MEMERWEMTIPASGSHDLLPSWRQAREGLVRFEFGGRAHGTRADASLRPGNEAPVHMHAGPLASPAGTPPAACRLWCDAAVGGEVETHHRRPAPLAPHLQRAWRDLRCRHRRSAS